MNFPLLLHWQRLNVSCFMQYFMLWSVSSDGGDWPHLLHMKCNPEKQRKKQTFVAKMCNCDQFEIKIYLSENFFWNAKCHFMFLHDLNWVIKEALNKILKNVILVQVCHFWSVLHTLKQYLFNKCLLNALCIKQAWDTRKQDN